MALHAELYHNTRAGEQRGAARRSLRLDVDSAAGDRQSRAIVRNLSETGLLLESETVLAVGEELLVELPQAGAVPARVVWARRPFFGCEFVRPVSRAAISAALLKSPLDEPAVTLTSPVDRTWLLLTPEGAQPKRERPREATLALVLLAGVTLAFVAALVTLQLG